MSQVTKGRRQARILTKIEERYSTDHHGPRGEEDKTWRHKRGRGGRAKILKYVVTIRRNNVIWIAFS
jgi:hypothetical protein